MLIRTLTDLGRDLYRDDPTPAIPQRVVDIAAAGIIDDCDAASVTVGSAGTLTTLASAGALAEAMDRAQRLAGVGPAFDAIELPVVHAAGAAWESWPEVSSAAAEAGARSAASFAMLVGGADHERRLGSLNLYSTRAEGFTDEELEIGMLLATFVAVALALAEDRDFTAQREAALHEAITTRDIIGQAKGILMERQHLSAEGAFEVLRRASQRMNVKLQEVAERLAQNVGAPQSAGAPEAAPAPQAAPVPPLNSPS
ncbi:MAG: ANTAR domain-containing protein [Acidimicrobiales bacterium]